MRCEFSEGFKITILRKMRFGKREFCKVNHEQDFVNVNSVNSSVVWKLRISITNFYLICGLKMCFFVTLCFNPDSIRNVNSFHVDKASRTHWWSTRTSHFLCPRKRPQFAITFITIQLVFIIARHPIHRFKKNAIFAIFPTGAKINFLSRYSLESDDWKLRILWKMSL